MRLLATFVLALGVSLLCASSAAAEFETGGSFGSEGSGNGQLAHEPGRAAVEPSTGNVFVVDTGNNRIEVFKPTGAAGGEYLTQFGTGLSEPKGIAVDQQGGQTYVYVADVGNNRVVKYDSDEAATPSFSVDPAFILTPGKIGDYHASLGIDPTTHDLLVADPGTKTIERFKGDGTFVSAFDGSAGAGSPGTFNAVLDVAGSPSGDVYAIVEYGESFVQQAVRYSGAGAYKATLLPVGDHQHPATVAVDPSSGQVAVSGNQDAIQWFQAPTLHVFDAADNPLSSPQVEYQYASFYGLAFNAGKAYAVLDIGANPYGFPSAPRVDVFLNLHKPSLTIDPVAKEAMGADSAEFTGTVNPEGLATNWHFEYSADGGDSWTSLPGGAAGTGTSPIAVSTEATGLEKEVTYQVRLVAANSDGQRATTPQQFRINFVREVKTDPASSVTATSATLNGTVNPGGVALTRCEFEFGVGKEYGQTLPCAESLGAIGSGEASVHVHADVSGLEVRNYHFRLVAANADGENVGADAVLATVAAPTLSGLSGVIAYPDGEGIEARLKVRLNPGNAQTTYHLEYGTTTTYGQSTADRQLRADNQDKGVFLAVGSLALSTTYHFRLVASNSAGSSASEDLTLTTSTGHPTDSCPNAAIRAAQGSTYLAECRAYEMVSPLDKGGNEVRGNQISPDGGSVAFASGGGLPGVGALSGVSYYRSTRLGSDWSGALSIDPPQKANSQNLRYQQVMAISEDQSRALVYSSTGLAPGATERGSNLYIRDLDTNTYHLVATGKVLMEEFSNTNAPPFFEIEGNADFSRIVFETALQLTPDAPEPMPFGARLLYEWSLASGIKLIGHLPDGTPIRAVRPFVSPKIHSFAAAPSRYLYVNDYVFGERSPGIYLREGDHVVQITASQRSGDDPEAVHIATFLGAAADFSVIYFKSTDDLTEQSDHGGSEALYRYDAPSGHLTDLTAGFGNNELDRERLNGFFFAQQGQVTPDGEAIYLGTISDLAPGGEPGTAFGSHAYIFRFTKTAIEKVSSLPAVTGMDFLRTGATSPNGRYLVYESVGSDTDDTSSGPSCENGECQQVYLYDSVMKTLACVSCEPSGAQSRGPSELAVGTLMESPFRSVTNQGVVGFQTPNALVPQDVNDKMDVYTWKDGELNLISSGKGPAAYYDDMTPDGSSILFTTAQKLVGRDDDELGDAYVARIDGGFATQNAVPKTAPCEGAECKGLPGTASGDPGVGTSTFSGPGNVKPAVRCAKRGKNAAKQRCLKQKRHKAKKHKRKHGAAKGRAGR